MFSSVESFFQGIIDYAGLFPPARLPMAEAVKNYLAYRQSGDAWMLNRFVVRFDQLEEMLESLPGQENAFEPVPVSLVTRRCENIEDLLSQASQQQEHLQRIVGHSEERIAIEAIEQWIAPSALEGLDPEVLASFAESWQLIFRPEAQSLDLFLEIPLDEQWQEKLPRWMQLLQKASQPGLETPFPRLGFKLRCGGQDPAQIPTPEQAAHVLVACRDHGIPFKATAGLHHPFRHYNAKEKRYLHGFVNLFGAGILAHARKLDLQTVVEIIEDEDFVHFMFTPTSFSWKDLQVPVSRIREAREKIYRTFGSCSFEEPLDDLRSLGLLD